MAKLQLILIGFAFLLFSSLAPAQELKVEGYFMQDSAKLGERVGYVLKASYSQQTNLIFPDSTFDFGSMAFLEKKTYISHTENNITVDSAVYYVSNFSLDPVSKFSLPVFEILKYDSVSHYPEEAGLALKLMIDPLPEQLAFQDNNVYQPIATDFNYPVLFLVLGIVLVLAILSLVFLRKPIRRQWVIWMEKRKYKRFLNRWENVEKSFASDSDMSHADELLSLWKTYMEHLKNKPFREWTTVEISDFLENKEIIKDFREIEMIIYAGKGGQNIEEACKNLKGICTQTYQQKIVERDERK